MQPQVKRYAPPIAKWKNVVKNGVLLFRFDSNRGIIEIEKRGIGTILIDLAEEAERHELRESEQIVS